MVDFFFSFRGLSSHGPIQGHNNTKNINVNSGADILHHYQVQWNELHKLAEENALKAQVCLCIYIIFNSHYFLCTYTLSRILEQFIVHIKYFSITGIIVLFLVINED